MPSPVHLPRLRWLACSVAACVAMLATSAASLAQEPTDEPVCALLTPDEVGEALGTSVGTGVGWTYEGYATCNWIAIDPASFAYADAEWQGIALEQIESGLPGGSELTVGGRPAYLAPDVGAIFIQLDTGLLSLSMEAADPDVDVEAALIALGEAAVPRAGSLPVPAPVEAPDLAGTLPEDDPVAEAFCALFTPQEVGAALGVEVEAGALFESCGWTSTGSDGTFASAAWVTGTLDEQQGLWPEGSDLSIAGRPAYYAPDLGSLFVDTGDGVMVLTAFGFGPEGSLLDTQEALTKLAELAVARSATLLPAPTLEPVPSFATDAGLEAMFPDEVGGEPLEVQSVAGIGAVANDPELLARIEDMLSAQGKTADDVSVAIVSRAGFIILAFKVAGGDASAFGPLVLESFGVEITDQSAGQVAGKDVTIVSSGGETAYMYPSGEVVWLVGAEEPLLTEILTALP